MVRTYNLQPLPYSEYAFDLFELAVSRVPEVVVGRLGLGSTPGSCRRSRHYPVRSLDGDDT